MFSVVTPSFRASQWLKLCIASVADQEVSLEHIVQDPGSDDGTLDWLPEDRRVKAFIEKDGGMYDAINRGFRRSTGDILAWLNCDEQYLPGALKLVEGFFAGNPNIDLVFGDVVVVGLQGQYLHHRKMQTPLKHHTWTVHLSTLSCGMFFRRRVFFEAGGELNPKLRAGSDGEWVLRLLQRKVKMAALGQFTSLFTETGVNLGAGETAKHEAIKFRRSAPGWVQALRPVWIVQHRLRRLLGGMYRQEPFSYAIYTLQSPDQRVVHRVDHPSPRQRALPN